MSGLLHRRLRSFLSFPFFSPLPFFFFFRSTIYEYVWGEIVRLIDADRTSDSFPASSFSVVTEINNVLREKLRKIENIEKVLIVFK